MSMQCYRPIRIYNNKLVYKDGFDKPSLFVPCGNCEVCTSNLQNDWTIRAYFHWKYYQSLGGCTLFITNTYRQQDSPIYGKATVPIRWVYNLDKVSNKLSRYSFKCFNKDDIDTYINSIRKYFRRKYGIGKNSSDTSINYLVCCEYGSQGTHAPHYHILFFFPPMPASKSEIKEVCDRLWSKGFSYYSLLSSGGAFVNSVFAIKYVAKYCCKDMDFYNMPEIQLALQKEYTKKNLKRNLPRHWQSNGFGASMVNYISSLNDPLEALLSGVRMDMDMYRYNVPLYVRNKMLFDIIYLRDDKGDILHTVRKLNSYGFELAPRIYHYNFERVRSNLDRDLSILGLQKYILDNNDLQDFFKENPTIDLSGNFRLPDVVRKLHDLLKPYSIDDLAKYSLVYRGFTTSDLDKLGPKKYMHTIKEFSDHAESVYLMRAEDSFRSSIDIPDLKRMSSRMPSQYLLNYCPDFRNFEIILVTLDLLKQRFNKRVSLAKAQRYRDSKFLKQKFIYTV